MKTLVVIDLKAEKSTDSKKLTIYAEDGIFCACIDNQKPNFDIDDRGFESIEELLDFLVKRELKRCSKEVIEDVKNNIKNL